MSAILTQSACAINVCCLSRPMDSLDILVSSFSGRAHPRECYWTLGIGLVTDLSSWTVED